VWHPEARPWGPRGAEARTPVTYEQAGTLRDALAAAIALEGFHRQCAVLTMANLAQTVNVLHTLVMTEGASMWITPTYYVFQLHAPHIGATAIPVATTQGVSQPGQDANINAVTATASLKDGRTAVTIINRHYDQPASVTLVAPATARVEQAQLLTADSPRAVNSAADPTHVAPAALDVHADGKDRWRIELPPHCMATIELS
jgi:alpha-N-arabinofuranosidase